MQDSFFFFLSLFLFQPAPLGIQLRPAPAGREGGGRGGEGPGGGGGAGGEVGTKCQRLPERARARSSAGPPPPPAGRPPPPPPLSRVLLLLLLLPGSGGGAGRRGVRTSAPRCAPGPLVAPVPRASSRAAAAPLRSPQTLRGNAPRRGAEVPPPPPGPERQPPSVPAWRGQERAGRSERPAAAKSPAAPSFLKRGVSNAALNQRALQLKLHCLKHNSSGLRGLHASV